MLRASRHTCFTAILLLAAQPCIAAEDYRDRGMPQRSSAAYAGAALKLPLGRRASEPNLRLQAGFTHSYGDAGSAAPASVHRVSILELGATRAGRPALSVAGQDLGQAQQRLGLNGATGTTLLVVGGVLVAVVVLAVAAGTGMGDTCPTIDGSRDHCINP